MFKKINPTFENTSSMLQASEQSVSVQSANWKEHILLEKKLSVLNRSERNLVHRITSDQKVMFRRFQMKLHKSKISHAELMGQKEMVRELRALYLRELNTNCGQRDGDYEFLKKLQYRPCVIGGPEPHRSNRGAGGPLRNVVKDLRSAVRSKSAGTLHVLANADASTGGFPPSMVPPRPATASGTRIEKEFKVLPDIPGSSVAGKIDAIVAEIYAGTKVDTMGNTSAGHQPRASINGDMLPLSLATASDSAKCSKRKTRSQIEAKPRNTLRERRSSMFEEVKNINWLEIRLNEAKAVDHVPRIKTFCASLKRYEVLFHDECFDYYAHNMQTSMQCAPKDIAVVIPGTPEVEKAKYIGNSTVKSLTMPSLKMKLKEDLDYD